MPFYETTPVLDAVDRHTAVVLGLCALALAGNYILWIENLRLGYRHRIYTMPLPCLAFFIVHDATFVAYYDKWFHQIDHWFPKVWWAGLVVTLGMELTFLHQFLRFGREELAPRLSSRAFVAATCGAVAVAAVPWLVIKRAMEDELFLVIFGVTVFWCTPFYLALMWRRQDPAGQSTLAWLGFLMMPAFYWPATWILAPGFHSLVWNTLGAATFLGGVANLVCIRWLHRGETLGALQQRAA